MKQAGQRAQLDQNIIPSSWKELTAEQMAIFLRDFVTKKDGSFFMFWPLLKKYISENDKTASMSKTKYYNLSGFVGGLFAYFFTFIAAMYEKSQGGGLKKPTAMDKIAVKYHLDQLFLSDRAHDYNFYIRQILPSGNYQRIVQEGEKEKKISQTQAQKNACWAKIQYYLSCNNVPQVQDSLERIFDWLRRRNSEYLGNKDTIIQMLEGSGESASSLYIQNYIQENAMGSSYGNCLMILDNVWPQGRTDLWICANKQFPDKFPVAPAPNPKAGAEQAEDDKLEGIQFAKDAKDLIEQGVKQIIFTGAPGTGKTYAAKLLAQMMGARQPWNEDVCYTLVQFHPSYDYTDFVEGLRPVPVTGSETGEFKFGKLDGHFKAFCRRVLEQNDPDGKYFFIIDEINRAELSKVFGELMYCLEADKRGKKNSVRTQYQNLPTYSIEENRCLKSEEDDFSGGFFIPDNVIVIGTMNDIDRSVESMDFALRRRFEWIEAKVDKDMLTGAFRRFGGVFNTYAEELAKDIMALNGTIETKGRLCGLNRQYFISQGQFANLPKDKFDKPTGIENLKRYVWAYRIEPLLREYLRGEWEKNITAFVDSCREAFGLPAAKEVDGHDNEG